MKHKYLFALLILLVVSFNSCDYEKDFDLLVEKATGAKDGDDGGSGPCPRGTWYSSACGDAKGVVWKFGSDNKGSMSNKDCNGVCTPIVFTFSYSIQGSTINLVFDALQPEVNCTGHAPARPPKPANSSISFVCGGNTLTVTSGNGSNVFTR